MAEEIDRLRKDQGRMQEHIRALEEQMQALGNWSVINNSNQYR
jgi:translation initiation factor 6 (eIF-6)